MGVSSPPPTSDARTLVSADGTELYADAIGDPSKPSVVFIHGFSLSSFAFEAIFNDPLWIDHVYLVRYDVRGHGRSGKPEDDASWDSKRLAEDFDAVIQAFKLIKPFVIGWSLGASYIADVLSFYPPSYLSGVVYVNGIPFQASILRGVASPASAACLPHLMQTGDVKAYQEAALKFVSLCSDSLPHPMRLAFLGDFLMQPRVATTWLLARPQDETGLLKAGRECGLPLLIINGKLDSIIVGDEVVNAVKGWRNLKVVEMKTADHMPWLEHPDTMRREILIWIEAVLRAS